MVLAGESVPSLPNDSICEVVHQVAGFAEAMPISSEIVQEVQVQLTLRSTLGPVSMILSLLLCCDVPVSVTLLRCSCLCYCVAMFLPLLPGFTEA